MSAEQDNLGAESAPTGPVPEAADASTSYDQVPYLSGARGATSIDRLGTLGRLLGMEVADPQHCRVLELGCGDGGNLIPMAVSFPNSEFLGVDLARTAVERGLGAIGELRIPNIRLVQGTFAAVGEDNDAFDYVIAHGIYSWVPAEVRDQLLDVIRRVLAPNGVAFVSYNALPGSHMRGVLREMMLLHTRSITDPAEKIAQARELLAMLMRAPAQAGDVYRPLLQSEVGIAMQTSDFLLYHDDLSEVNQPFFFADFMADAQRHGLQFAAEANFSQMSTESLPPDLAGQLAELGQRDLLAKEQYLDFMTCRSFRQTLLCHEAVGMDRRVSLGRVRSFRIASDAREVPGEHPDGGVVAFAGPNTSALHSDHAAAIAVLRRLSSIYPRSLPFDELATGAGAYANGDAESLAEVLFRAYSAGVLEFHISEPGAVFDVSARPVASPWGRYRAASGRVVSLYHHSVSLGEGQAGVLQLLDGAHTASAIATELGREREAVATDIADFAAKGLLLG